MGKTAGHLRRFRTNPVEFAIFATVTLIFANSVYNLLYNYESFRFSALQPMSSNPISESRRLASVPAKPAPAETKCEGTLAPSESNGGKTCVEDPVPRGKQPSKF